MIFNKDKFTADIKKRITGTIQSAADECGVSYATMWRMKQTEYTLDIPTLIKALIWLNKPFEYYLKKEAENEIAYQSTTAQ